MSPGKAAQRHGFLWIEGSRVEVWALGGDRFGVRAPGHEQLLTGLKKARRLCRANVEGVRAAPALCK
jgi:hypothetical protein